MDRKSEAVLRRYSYRAARAGNHPCWSLSSVDIAWALVVRKLARLFVEVEPTPIPFQHEVAQRTTLLSARLLEEPPLHFSLELYSQAARSLGMNEEVYVKAAKLEEV